MKKLILSIAFAFTLAGYLKAETSDAEIRLMLHNDGYNQVPQAYIDSAREALPVDVSSSAIVAYMEIPGLRLQYKAIVARKERVADVTYDKEEKQGDWTKRTTVRQEENADLLQGTKTMALRPIVERWDLLAHKTGITELIAEADAKLAELQAAYYALGLSW
jgi:hypothetical protein